MPDLPVCGAGFGNKCGFGGDYRKQGGAGISGPQLSITRAFIDHWVSGK